MRVKIPIEKKNKFAPKNLLKSLKEENPEFSGISFKQVKGDEIKDELLTMEMRLVCSPLRLSFYSLTLSSLTCHG